jgi:hypothetical protein
MSAQMSRERTLEPFVEMSFAVGDGGAIDWFKMEPAMPIVKFKWTERHGQFAAASTVGCRAGRSAWAQI